MMTRNTFVFDLECLARSNLTQHCREAEPVIGGPIHGLDHTEAAEDCVHNRTTFLLLALQELKQIRVCRVA